MVMTIETLNIGDHVSARLIDKQTITGTISSVKVEAYRPGEHHRSVVKIYYTIDYVDDVEIPRKKVVREYEIITNESK